MLVYAHDKHNGWADGYPDDEIVEAATVTLRMLADPTRMRMLWLLGQSEYDVTALTEAVDAARPAVSQHLAKLRLAGLVQVRGDGRRNLYSARGVHVTSLLTEVFSSAEHHVRNLPDHTSAPRPALESRPQSGTR